MSGKRITELQQSTTLKNDSLLLVTTGSENGNLTRAITLEQFKNSICADYNTDGDTSDLFYSATKIDEILSENEENYQNWHNEHVSISEEVATNKANINANLSKIKSNTNLINLIYDEQEQELIKDSGKTLYTYFNDKAKSLNTDIDKIWTLMVGSSIKYSLENDGIFIRDPRGKDIGTFDTAYGALNNRITALENAIGSSNEWDELVETGFDTAEGDPYTHYKTLKEKITEEIDTVDKRVEMTVGKTQQNLSVVFGETVSEFEKREFVDNDRKYYKHYLGDSYGYTIDGKMYPMIIDYQNSHHTEGNNWVNKSNITGRGTIDRYGITELSVLQLTIGAQVEDLRRHGLGHYNFDTESSFTAHDYKDSEWEFSLRDSHSDYHLSDNKYIPLVPHINPIRIGSERTSTTGPDVDMDILDFSYIDRINLTAGKRFNELEKSLKDSTNKLKDSIKDSTNKLEDSINQIEDNSKKNISFVLSNTLNDNNYLASTERFIDIYYLMCEAKEKYGNVVPNDIKDIIDHYEDKLFYTVNSSVTNALRICTADEDKIKTKIYKDSISSISGSHPLLRISSDGYKYAKKKLGKYLGKTLDTSIENAEEPGSSTNAKQQWYSLDTLSIIDLAVGALRKDIDCFYKNMTEASNFKGYLVATGVSTIGYDIIDTSNIASDKTLIDVPYIDMDTDNTITKLAWGEMDTNKTNIEGFAIEKSKISKLHNYVSFKLTPSSGSFNAQFSNCVFKYNLRDLFNAGYKAYAEDTNLTKDKNSYAYVTQTLPGDILNIKTGENSILNITLGARLFNFSKDSDGCAASINPTTLNTAPDSFRIFNDYGDIIPGYYYTERDYYLIGAEFKLYIYCMVKTSADKPELKCFTPESLSTLRQKYYFEDIEFTTF